MDDDLVRAAASLTLGFRCCDRCCQPRFFFLPGDLEEEVLSRMSKRKFYIVNRGTPRKEGIYSHWDLAKVYVLGVSGAVHESCRTGDGARQIWARFCHNNHTHSTETTVRRPPPSTPASSPAPPPPYRQHAPPTLPVVPSPTTRTSHWLQSSVTPRAPLSPPATPRPDKYYRVSGSPRVLIRAEDAEAELRATQNGSLLVGASLEDVEDDDEVTAVDTTRFYRVFGSPRVQRSRSAAVDELINTRAAGLLVGETLGALDI
ncbi:hypothetical protein C8R47DRAFT_1213619 [Mycena vitilis]|nr:hypothetical protein C8R47DRAFT_1213619 [Mycena vitilis]